LGAALRNTGSSYRDLNERQKDLTQRLFRDRPFKSMYICLATDALDSMTRAVTHEPQQLDSPEDTLLLSSSLREHILCAVKLYQDGVLEISPAFSSIVEEDSTATLLQSSIGQAGSPMSVFLDDSTIEAGMRKGFRLSSFKVRSIKGAEYEYVLHNVNDILVPHQLEAIETKQSVQNAIKAAENRGSTIGGHNWKQDPSKKDRTLGVYAEIVSGKSFEGDSLVVTYELVLPQNWTLRTGDLSDGVANSDRDTASVSSASSASMHSGSRAGDYGMMHGATHAAIASQPIRTFFQIPLHRPKWRGIQLAYSLESCSLGEPSRIIIGLSFFVVSVFSVIVGLEYPFWVVPALGILLVTGMGVPGGPPQVVLIRNTTTTTNSTIMKVNHQQNSRDRTPQVDTHSPTAVFNHLIRFSVDVSDIDSAAAVAEGGGQGYASKAPSAHMATLVFQVYSSCWFGRYRLEGCGYHHLSDRPGQEAVEIKTWKPVGGGIRDKMNDLFLGNSVQFKDNLFVDSVNKASVALNKFGVQSQSSGSIFLRTQSISTDARRVDEFFREHSEQVVMHAEASNKVKKTVDDILRSFRSSTTGLPMRASSSREALGIAALTPSKQAMRSSRDSPNKPSSVSSILTSLNNASRDKDNRVAEILARARAKVQRGTGSSVSSSSSRATSSSTAPPPLQQQQQVDSSSSSSSSGSKSKSKRTMFGSGIGGANIDSPYKDMNTPYDPFIPARTGTELQQLQPTTEVASSLLAMDSTLVDRSIRLDRKAIPPIRGLRQPHRYDSPSSSDNSNNYQANSNNNNDRPPLSPRESTARQSDADDGDGDEDGEEAPLLLQS
jgi:hypothetical protein